MTRSVLLLASVLSLVVHTGARAAGNDLDAELREKGRHAVDAGLHFLRGTQAEDGSWSKSVGVTAIALRAFLDSHRHYTEKDGAFITRPIAFITKHANKDGSICESKQNTSYATAVAIVALEATGNPKYAPLVEHGRKFLLGHQVDEAEGYKPNDPYYGGMGYGGDERPDLSNAYLALEALHAAALDPKDPAWGKALKFVSRCQNRSESNDQPWAGNDGGFTYMPSADGSPHGGHASYGGMTHAGLISLLFAGADKNDPRVQAAYDWIRANYTLDANPGTKDKAGLYYYYEAFAKSMSAYGEPTVKTTDGVEHDWRADYVRKMVSLQNEDGSWVNHDSTRWWEGDKNLITARIVVGLDLATR
jgi:squalene-hopene/tetraprenyl-beta-curcumene cyclase